MTEKQNLSPRPAWGYEQGRGGAQGRRRGQTKASGSPYSCMRIKCALERPTVERSTARGNKKTVQLSELPLKRRHRSREGNKKALRAFLPFSKRGRTQSWKENARSARPNGEEAGGLALRCAQRYYNSAVGFHGSRGTAGAFVKRQTTEHPQITNQQNHQTRSQ